ncbi:hypothetical protein AGMMS49975_08360 [Clostridia bacterium]|nr:hypothetical protein AGMMS49975_08360 [Clostridia bacterium]
MSEDYAKIQRVISLIITDHTLINDSPKYHNRYTLRDPETGSEFTDLIEVNVLELPKLPPAEDGSKLWEWMKFLDARRSEDLDMIAEKNPQVKKAVVRLLELSGDEHTRLLYESRQKMGWDNQARERSARLEGVQDVALKLIARGRPIGEIIEDTGLTRDEVAELTSR